MGIDHVGKSYLYFFYRTSYVYYIMHTCVFTYIYVKYTHVYSRLIHMWLHKAIERFFPEFQNI